MQAVAAAAVIAFVELAAWTAGARAQDVTTLEGRVVREIRVGPVRRPDTADMVRGHLATRVGETFAAARLIDDRRRLDALRLFSAIDLQPIADGDGVVLDVRVKETLALLPFLAFTVTDALAQRQLYARSTFVVERDATADTARPATTP